MKTILAVLALGVLGGVCAHLSWLHYRLAPMHDDLDAQLAWMQHDLNLSPDQYARIKEIHQQSNAHLISLNSRVTRMRDELAAFEQQRKTTGEVDFLEFAAYIQTRRAIDRECLQSTRELVDASTELMTAQQRNRYLQLLPLLDRPGSVPASN
jgi:hypothetical protein